MSEIMATTFPFLLQTPYKINFPFYLQKINVLDRCLNVGCTPKTKGWVKFLIENYCAIRNM